VLTKEGFHDIDKIEPLIFNTANLTCYGAGKYLGNVFFIGKKKKE
jgi:hypothetical protein